MQFIPVIYGTSECLTAATDCLLKRVQAIIMPEKKHETGELALYARCLRSLQEALQDSSRCHGPDVLCASQLLGLREVCFYLLMWILIHMKCLLNSIASCSTLLEVEFGVIILMVP